jgi:hypothetical protein
MACRLARPTLWATVFAGVSAAAGCSSSAAPMTQAKPANAPSSLVAAPDFESAAEELSFAQNGVAPGEEPADGSTRPVDVASSSPTAASATTGNPLCHPDLFAISVAYAWALDYHLYLFLQGVDDALAAGPRVVSDTTHQWTSSATDGTQLQVTLDKTAPGIFRVDESLAASAGGPWVSVMSGTVDHSDASGVTKTLTFDLDAFHQVVPASASDRSAGQLAARLERTMGAGGDDLKVAVTYTLTAFVPVYGDPRGPRTGNVSFLEEPGVGGAMTFDASVMVACSTDPSIGASDTNVYARWYAVQNGAATVVAGRADGRATGGPVAPASGWVGVSCRSVPLARAQGDAPGGSMVADNGYWMVKQETASGATVAGSFVSDASATDPPCDPAFGPVPDAADAASDASLSATIPVAGAFPGEF